MTSVRAHHLWLMTVLLISSSVESAAQVRAAPPQWRASQGTRALSSYDQRVSAIYAWLRQLAGDFRIERSVILSPLIDPCSGAQPGRCQTQGLVPLPLPSSPAAEGAGRCTVIGNGPGITCRFDFHSAGQNWSNIKLFGVDPDGPAIRVMQIEPAGAAETSVGRLDGQVATFPLLCPADSGGSRCTATMKITMSRDLQRIEMNVTELWRSGRGPARQRGQTGERTETVFTLERQ